MFGATLRCKVCNQYVPDRCTCKPELPKCDPTQEACPRCGNTTRKDLSCEFWKHVEGLADKTKYPKMPEPDTTHFSGGARERFKYHSLDQVVEYANARVAHVTASLMVQLKEMEELKDAAYTERNQVVAALSKAFPSGVARTAIPGWAEEWHGCVFIDLPTGQASWHFHDSQAHLFEHLKPYTGKWDGHTTEEKYKRVALLRNQGWSWG